MVDVASDSGKAGTTALPEFKLPPEMSSLHDLRALHKANEELVRLRYQQVEKGKVQKAKNQETLDGLKQKNDVLKNKIKEQRLAAETAAANQGRGKKNIDKDLANKRRKLDDMKAKTAAKRQQFNKLQERAQEASSVTADLSNEDHPMMRQIKSLGNRLDKVMIKYNEAIEMKRTFEII